MKIIVKPTFNIDPDFIPELGVLVEVVRGPSKGSSALFLLALAGFLAGLLLLVLGSILKMSVLYLFQWE